MGLGIRSTEHAWWDNSRHASVHASTGVRPHQRTSPRGSRRGRSGAGAGISFFPADVIRSHFVCALPPATLYPFGRGVPQIQRERNASMSTRSLKRRRSDPGSGEDDGNGGTAGSGVSDNNGDMHDGGSGSGSASGDDDDSDDDGELFSAALRQQFSNTAGDGGTGNGEAYDDDEEHDGGLWRGGDDGHS